MHYVLEEDPDELKKQQEAYKIKNKDDLLKNYEISKSSSSCDVGSI